MKIKSILCLVFGLLGALLFAVSGIVAASPFLIVSFVLALVPFWNQRLDIEGLVEKILRK